MPGYNLGVHSGALVLLRPPRLLGHNSYDGLRRRLLRISVSRFLGGDSVLPTVSHHFHCGGGRSGASLGIAGGGVMGV